MIDSKILKTLLIQFLGLFILISCNTNNKGSSAQIKQKIPIAFNSYNIDSSMIGDFLLGKSIKEIKLPKFYDSKEVRITDEDGEFYLSEKFYLDKEIYIETILYDGVITEVKTNSNLFSTSDEIKVGSSFAWIFKKLKSNYSIEDDLGVLMLFDKRNHLRIWFTNSNIDLFTFDEKKDLFNHKLSIPKDRLDKMIAKQIDLISLKD
jgi:hypothetical protein